MRVIAIALFLFAGPLVVSTAAQDQTIAGENPLAQLKDQLKRVLDDARVPFTTEQESAVILMMEDRRKASEDLFGELMDFSAGPTQGQEADRLRSAIQWMRNEFLGKLQDYLRPDQLAAWSRSLETAETAETAANSTGPRGQGARGQNQTQYVRINNNAFTSEDNTYRFGLRGGGTGTAEVIQRGGAGAFHGNAQFLLKDDALNAGRRFASNKPPYQERETSFDISGPVIPGRLTTNFGFSQSEAENVDTIRATLPDTIFALGITRPTTNRALNSRNTFQLADGHSLSFNLGYSTNHSENQGVGGFVMPDRAYHSSGNNWNFELRQFSSISAQSIYETRFNYSGNHNTTIPNTTGVRINVTDAFSNGGAQNDAENTGRTYDFSNLYTRLGEKLTLKTGSSVIYRKNRSISENNFIGTFTFSGLEAYRQGRPINFRVGRGIAQMDTDQWDMALFAQNDLKLTSRLTLMYGVRYETQTNLNDRNNIDPRVGFAYALGNATVIRGGSGIFHQRLSITAVENQTRLNGTQQYEIVIDNPSYPDPFQAGTVRNTFPSVRVTDPDLASPYTIVAAISFERTLLNNLFFSASFDFTRDVHRIRTRNANAPRDITSAVPRSCSPGQSAATCVRPLPDRGNILNLESTGAETDKTLRFTVRKRFSIFNVSANYSLASAWASAQGGGSVGTGDTRAGFTADGLGSDAYNLQADWGHTPTSLHNLSTTVNAQLPLGIFLTNTMSAVSGRRYTLYTGRDDNQDTAVNDRPPGLQRNTLTGPTTLNFNFNISKAFFFDPPQSGTTRKNVNVFANMTNAFNRPNYQPASGVLTSPNFGRYTNAGEPREIEVGLRFQF